MRKSREQARVSRGRARVSILARVVAVATAVGGSLVVGVGPAAAAPQTLSGLFSLDSGSCGGGSVTGSFFRMILPAGNTSGPFLANNDSTCSDKTVTLLSAGSGGGLVAGDYQPQPAQAFDGSGNALSGNVSRPVKFYGVGFATATNPTDPQTGKATGRPTIQVDGTSLTGDLSSFGVTWNNQVFNQGAPKPGGSYPGKTSPVSGTIDPQTGAYVLEWTSQIQGGPFNNFTGLWHLSGTFQGQGLAATEETTTAAPPTSQAPAAPNSKAPKTSAKPAPPGQTAPAPAAPQAVTANPQLAVQSVQQDNGQPRWLLPVLVVATAVAAALLTNADRLFRRRG